MITIVTFKDKNWIEIPRNENPAFDYIRNAEGICRIKECLVICRVLPYESNTVGIDGYLVIHVPFAGATRRLGVFWHYELAEVFATAVLINDRLLNKEPINYKIP